MKNKCSECGKTCGDNAHRNMKGEFSGQILCGLCYSAYETDLETRWASLRREYREINAKMPIVSNEPYDSIEYHRRLDQIHLQMAPVMKAFGKVRDKYWDLTGKGLGPIA